MLKCHDFVAGFTKGGRDLQELVLKSMYNDEITKIVQQDDLICTYGSSMLMSSGIKQSHEISQRMRILARLTITLRNETKKLNFSLADFIEPEYFDTFIKSARILGGFSIDNTNGENISSFATPSLALKMPIVALRNWNKTKRSKHTGLPISKNCLRWNGSAKFHRYV